MDVAVEDVVIVGAGIAGLATALGLHRLGVGSLVLESSESLRVTGFALTTWTNAWNALETLGLSHSLRPHHLRIDGLITASAETGQSIAQISFQGKGKHGEYEIRCIKRKLLLEALQNELPSGTIRFSSKVVSIEESGYFKLLHLVDGTTIKAKVLIGCDGVNSVVAKWLGFKQTANSGRSCIRGCIEFDSSHGFGSKFQQFFGSGLRAGFVPCDDKTIYWYNTYDTSGKDKEFEENPAKMKQFVLNNLANVPDDVRTIVEVTKLDSMTSSVLRYRYPWEILWGNISRGNVCVAGDALHPMTPDLGQGGCCALEDSVVLARCLATALKGKPPRTGSEEGEKEEYERIEMGLKKYANERRWRSIDLISTAYVVGRIQQSSGRIMTFLKDKFLIKLLRGYQMKKADFDCGKLDI